MNRLLHRFPFICLLIPYATGILTAHGAGPLHPLFSAILVAAGLAAYGLTMKFRPERSAVFLICACLSFGIFNHYYHYSYIPADSIALLADTGRYCRIRGTVTECPVFLEGGDFNRLTIAAESVGSGTVMASCSGRIHVYAPAFHDDPAPGDLVELSGTVTLPSPPRNPGQADLRETWRRNRIRGSIFLRENRGVTLVRRSFLRSLVFRIRRFLGEQVLARYGPDTGPVVNSLLLGIRNGIGEDRWDHFRGSGTAHILAISGLHVGLLIGMLHFLLTRLRVGLRFRTILLLAVMAVYAVLSGFSLPVIRTVIMLTIHMAAPLCMRQPNIRNTLAAAAFLILLADPLQLLAPGFILSFTAILALVYLTPLLQELLVRKPTEIERLFPRNAWYHIIGRAVRTSVLISTAAWLGTFPVIIHYFMIITPYAVAANLAAIPLVAVILGAGFLFLLTAGFGPLGLPFALVGRTAAAVLLRFVKTVSGLPLAVVGITRFPLVLYYTVLIILVFAFRLRPKTSRRRKWVAVAAAFLCIGLYFPLTGLRAVPPFEADCIDVGHGDCSLVRDGAVTVMVDTGSTLKADTVRQVLMAEEITAIDLLIISHYDEDHSGNVPMILEGFNVGTVLAPRPTAYDREAHRPVIAALEGAGPRVMYTDQAPELKIGTITVTLLSPPPPPFSGSNDRSAVVRVMSRGTSIIFTGDVEEQAIGLLLNAGRELDCDILKIPHHGRFTPALEELIAACSPAVALVSRGRRYLDPDEPLASFLDHHGIRLADTSRDGFCRIGLKDGYKVEAFLK